MEGKQKNAHSGLLETLRGKHVKTNVRNLEQTTALPHVEVPSKKMVAAVRTCQSTVWPRLVARGSEVLEIKECAPL